jgi:heme-degrading monooxygenase HmoA
MPLVVVTRLRLKDSHLTEDFFTHAVALIEQATHSDGNLGVDALAEANDVWWSVSAWRNRGDMENYIARDPHHSTSLLLDEFCNEATFVDWEQSDSGLPDWQTGWRHLVTDGRSAALTNPTAANQTRDFPQPVEPPPGVA